MQACHCGRAQAGQHHFNFSAESEGPQECEVMVFRVTPDVVSAVGEWLG